MTGKFDCIVCGETCLDLVVRTVDRRIPLDQQGTLLVDPIQPGTGGIVPNSGIAMTHLQLEVAAFGCVGDDEWSDLLCRRLESAGVNIDLLFRKSQRATSVTAILVDSDGEHTFAFHPGASGLFDAELIRQNIDVFENSRCALFGYYGLMSQVEQDLPELLQQIRNRGCLTALDAAAGGGSWEPLDRILPHLDIYVPSREEAQAQTGLTDPVEMIRRFRPLAPSALLGVKLGAEGALLSPSAEEWLEVAPIRPPSSVVDTTGAGDCFYAGLISGILHGFSPEKAGRLAAAAGAFAVTKAGATAGLPDFRQLCQVAGVVPS